ERRRGARVRAYQPRAQGAEALPARRRLHRAHRFTLYAARPGDLGAAPALRRGECRAWARSVEHRRARLLSLVRRRARVRWRVRGRALRVVRGSALRYAWARGAAFSVRRLPGEAGRALARVRAL